MGKTFKPYADYMNNLDSEESRRLWSVCLDGLRLFGLTEEHVTNVANVVGIRLPVRYAKKRSYSSWTMSVGRCGVSNELLARPRSEIAHSKR